MIAAGIIGLSVVSVYVYVFVFGLKGKLLKL